jgi:hypothetical protein
MILLDLRSMDILDDEESPLVFPCPVKSVSYSAYNRNTGPAEQ